MFDRLISDRQERLVAAMTRSRRCSAATNPKPQPVTFCATPARRFRLDRVAPRRTLRRRIWLGRTFEGLCAQIVADFANDYDPKRERCWIAEMNGENVGCVILVEDKDRVARLRLLLVDPKARGLGLGARLVDECVRFARQAGYRKITLWTHSVLTAARHVYEKAGFTLTVKREAAKLGQGRHGGILGFGAFNSGRHPVRSPRR